MTDSITLTLPEDIATLARRIAETTQQPVEHVLLEHLRTLATPLPASELDALQHLSDDTLWTLTREQLPDDVQARAHDLMQRTALDPDEQTALDALVERADRLMLRKAEAAAILRQRGYPITQHDFKPHDA
jgi:predicted acetyltransferase